MNRWSRSRLTPEVARLEVKSYPPRELAQGKALGNGDLALLNRLPEDLMT